MQIFYEILCPILVLLICVSIYCGHRIIFISIKKIYEINPFIFLIHLFVFYMIYLLINLMADIGLVLVGVFSVGRVWCKGMTSNLIENLRKILACM